MVLFHSVRRAWQLIFWSCGSVDRALQDNVLQWIRFVSPPSDNDAQYPGPLYLTGSSAFDGITDFGHHQRCPPPSTSRPRPGRCPLANAFPSRRAHILVALPIHARPNSRHELPLRCTPSAPPSGSTPRSLDVPVRPSVTRTHPPHALGPSVPPWLRPSRRNLPHPYPPLYVTPPLPSPFTTSPSPSPAPPGASSRCSQLPPARPSAILGFPSTFSSSTQPRSLPSDLPYHSHVCHICLNPSSLPNPFQRHRPSSPSHSLALRLIAISPCTLPSPPFPTRPAPLPRGPSQTPPLPRRHCPFRPPTPQRHENSAQFSRLARVRRPSSAVFQMERQHCAREHMAHRQSSPSRLWCWRPGKTIFGNDPFFFLCTISICLSAKRWGLIKRGQ